MLIRLIIKSSTSKVLRSMANRGIIHMLNQTILFKQNKTKQANKTSDTFQDTYENRFFVIEKQIQSQTP